MEGEVSEVMLRHGWNERRKSEAKKKEEEGVGFWVSLCFLFSNTTVNLNVKQQFYYVSWRLRVEGGISHYMVDMLIH